MTSEREAWTKFVEQREREKQRKRPRAKKQSGPSQQEPEAALDDLVGGDKRGIKVKDERP